MSRRVVLESPYAGDVAANTRYARAAMKDSLKRGESPLASHLLYTQVLDDNDPLERTMGISAGNDWIDLADALVVYTDRGISIGMQKAIDLATELYVEIEYRTLYT